MRKAPGVTPPPRTHDGTIAIAVSKYSKKFKMFSVQLINVMIINMHGEISMQFGGIFSSKIGLVEKTFLW